jgi:hypothetical protein
LAFLFLRPSATSSLGSDGVQKQNIFERSEKTVFVWVSKKHKGPTKQPQSCESRQLDHNNEFLSVSEKTVFVWVSKKHQGPTKQPQDDESRQLDHRKYKDNCFICL